MSRAVKDIKAAALQRRASDVKERLLDEIAEQALKQAGDGEPEIDLGAFVRAYFRNVAAEDLRESKASDLAGAALGHLRFGLLRAPQQARVRIFNPCHELDGWESTHTVIELVNDDMPFLVDSVGLAVNRMGLSVQLTVHPVLRVSRDADGRLRGIDEDGDDPAALADSFLHMQVSRETDQALLDELESNIQRSLLDVRAACQDWKAMRATVHTICDELEHSPPPIPEETLHESIAMLRWMEEHHFTFLGYREYHLERDDEGDRLVPVTETGLGILRRDTVHKSRPPELGRFIRKQVRSKELLIITKANSKATVHRPGYLDYVGVKHFDKRGRVIGERRFLGLFTSVAYSRNPRAIPLLRHKVAQVMSRSALGPDGHAGKALSHILDTYPRDELFQSSVEDLSRIAEGVLSLQERQRVRMFIRRDAFRRFISCLVYVPRDRYSTKIRRRIEQLLITGLDGTSAESQVQLSDSNLARMHTIVRTKPASSAKIRLKDLQRKLEDAVRSWEDKLRDALIDRLGEGAGLKLLSRFGSYFPTAYREDVSPRAASYDCERLAALEELPDSLQMSLYRPPKRAADVLRFRLFKHDSPMPLSDALPMLENMGLRVIGENPYRVELPNDRLVWIHDFSMTCAAYELKDPDEVNDIFQAAFERVYRGDADDDGFNRLVLGARLTWREAAVLRAYCRYLLQTGLPFSQTYMEEVLGRHPEIARRLVDKFHARLDPEIGPRKREKLRKVHADALERALDAVASLDEDRIMRAFFSVVRSTLRTNFFQVGADGKPKSYISFKLDPEGIPDLPEPKPMFEIFVYSPRVEGVHLRSASVARGGLRWSDRREDFRTEVLGLMKAQKVKNTLIVPMGAKGGFVCKVLPEGDRDAIMAEVVECYKTFIRGLLDITDNIVDEKIVPPDHVVRRDGDDPYLVVAADKGTATFSDTANAIAQSYNFWLDDAFASGGSAGYDHKKMGITAKGGWEAVKRHFREIGVDVQSHEFAVAGVGDMSGDVFGNGMLLSRFIRLRAAFNHLDIFLDPDPDPATGFAERQRLFELRRSSWSDYDASLISSGGGVFSRRAKQLTLSPEIRAMLGVEEETLPPNEVVKAILKMPVDLLWNGGIGTYVKGRAESDDDVGDRVNDAVRVNGADLRCKVVGEGGNLGLTQLGRIEFALNDGRINTDFIDNSAGVDCSDREVNIKILLSLAARTKRLPKSRRDALLAEMTDEVSRLVLRDNYLQTQAISMVEAHASERLREHAHLIRMLERDRELDRDLEFLPGDAEIDERLKAGNGLTRPEIATLVSYSKMSLYSALIESDVPEDAYLARELARYFPEPVQRRYGAQMSSHPLAREIIATQVTNSLVNRMGPTFVKRTMEETGAPVSEVARAFTIGMLGFDMRSIWSDIEELDNAVHANVQYSMILQTARLLRHASYWLLAARPEELNVASSVARFQPGIAILAKRLPKLLSKNELKRFKETAELYSDIGVPDKLARHMAGLPALYSALDIVDVARDAQVEEALVAGVYFRLGGGLSLEWLRDRIDKLAVKGRWQAMARNSLRENLYHLQRDLTSLVVRQYPGDPAGDAVSAWLESNYHRVGRVQHTLDEMRATGAFDFATLSVAVQEIRKMAQS